MYTIYCLKNTQNNKNVVKRVASNVRLGTTKVALHIITGMFFPKKSGKANDKK